MAKDNRSFFEKLTGSGNSNSRIRERDEEKIKDKKVAINNGKDAGWGEEDAGDGQLTVDVYQTPDDIVIKTITAGVKPDEVDIVITRDMVTIRGQREISNEVNDNDYFSKELYWGTFSRTILLPQEIDVEAAEASEKHGLLTIKLPKLDKRRETKLKVKSF